MVWCNLLPNFAIYHKISFLERNNIFYTFLFCLCDLCHLCLKMGIGVWLSLSLLINPPQQSFISTKFFEGFSWNLLQIFSSLRQCTESMSHPLWSRSRSHLKVKCLSLCFMSVPYLPHSLKDFHKTWLKILVHWDDLQKAWVSNFNSRSMSHLGV